MIRLLFVLTTRKFSISATRMSLPLFVPIKLPNGTTYEQPTGLFINNEFVQSKSKKTFGTVSPSTEEEITQVYEAFSEDIDDAVEAATAAFHSSWSTSDPQVRMKVLYKLLSLIHI